MLDCKQSELGTGWGSYAIILLVPLLGSFTIAKFNGVSVYCFVVAHFSALYVYYLRYPVLILLHVDKLCKRYNFMKIQGKWPRMRKQSIPGRLSPPTQPGYETIGVGRKNFHPQNDKQLGQSNWVTNLICRGSYLRMVAWFL